MSWNIFNTVQNMNSCSYFTIVAGGQYYSNTNTAVQIEQKQEVY